MVELMTSCEWARRPCGARPDLGDVLARAVALLRAAAAAAAAALGRAAACRRPVRCIIRLVWRFTRASSLRRRRAGACRAGGTRTPNRRFWRPVLCQLSYCPPEPAGRLDGIVGAELEAPQRWSSAARRATATPGGRAAGRWLRAGSVSRGDGARAGPGATSTARGGGPAAARPPPHGPGVASADRRAMRAATPAARCAAVIAARVWASSPGSARGTGSAGAEAAEHAAVAGELGLAAQARLDVSRGPRASTGSAGVAPPPATGGRPPHTASADLPCSSYSSSRSSLAAPVQPDLRRRDRDPQLLGDRLVGEARRRPSARRRSAASGGSSSSASASSADQRRRSRPRLGLGADRWSRSVRRRRRAARSAAAPALAIWVAAVLAVMRYIHVENCASPRNRRMPFQARR